MAAACAALLGVAVLAATPAVADPPAQSQSQAQGQPDSSKDLGEADRAEVAAAEAAGRPTVTLLVAAEPNQLDAAADQLRSLGGVVQKTDETVDYLKVEMPTGNAARAAKLDAVNAVDVDRLIPMDDPRPDAAENPIPQAPPGPSTPRVNPYLPTGDTNAAQFALANPTWDGRGTKIAVLDSGVDLDHPSLQTTSTGANKIVDWYNANSPTSGDGTWVSTTGRFTGVFTASAQSWTAPATGGPYAFGLFRETAQDLAAGELGGNVNRDGDTADSFGILQDRTTKRVWVDLDQDRDFTDETSMIDFKVNRDFQFFGTDNPATEVQEKVPFVVVTDRSNYNPDSDAGSVVNLGIAGAQHGSHVAGIAAGHSLYGGAMSGAAPGAEIIAVKVCLTTTSCTTSGLIDGVLYAANAGADVVNISIGGLPALNDGNNARSELYNRTITEFNMQIFNSAGNSGAGANTVGDPAVATNSMAVGSSITRETWLSNYGSEAANAKWLHPFSSRGPREDGGFKPQIVAPGAAISTTPRWQNGGPVAGVYTLPPGYSMLNGTSMAAPQATGAAALLVSAYKATRGGARPTAAQLRNAIMTGASYQDQLEAYEQGAGMFNVTKAWSELRKTSQPKASTITASVPVNTVDSGQLAVANTGTGINDREGIVAGGNYTRTYTLTRTSGRTGNISHDIRFLGDNGTFYTGPNSIRLPLNQPVQLVVNVRPGDSRIHSAIMQIDDPFTDGIDLMTMNTVYAAQDFTAANANSITKSGRVARNATEHLLVRVPAGASALKVDLTAGGTTPGAGQVRFLRFTPQGLPADVTSTTNCYNPDAGAGCSNGTPTSRTIVNPLPGVWEIVVEARRTSDVLRAPYSVTATVLGTSISPNPDVVASATVGVPQTRNYTVSNVRAGFTGRLVGGGSLGSTQTQRPTLAHLATQTFDVTVPAGVSQFVVRSGNSSDLRADIDMLVYRCNPGCVLVGSSGGSTAVEQVTLNNPIAALYRIEMFGFNVPTGSTQYDLTDTYVSAALGNIVSSDANAEHASGTSWSPTATLTVNGQPGAGRKLTGGLSVVTDAGVTVGAGTLVVDSVTG
jgi:subtilisin family serine protease